MSSEQALGLAALEPADVGLGDLLVGLDREQQRDVDVDPLVDRLLDRADALRRARDLDHHVRAVDRLPVGARRCERPLGVVREVGGDLERDEAVLPFVSSMNRREDVAGALDVA